MSQDAVICGERQLARDAERYLGRVQAAQSQISALEQRCRKTLSGASKLDALAANERRIAELEAEVARKLEILAAEKRAGEELSRLESRATELAKSAQTQKRLNQDLERRLLDAEEATRAAEREHTLAKDETRAALAEAREFQDE